MAPKVKITREMIIEKAFEIVKNEGVEFLNARSLSKKLKCSTQPIFSNFNNMEELISEVINKSKSIYNEYMENSKKYEKRFKGTGIEYIKFAKENPNLFKLLFMSKTDSSYQNVTVVESKQQDIQNEIIAKSLNISIEEAKYVQLQSWVFVHGIASLIVTNTASFDDFIIDKLLIDFYKGLLKG